MDNKTIKDEYKRLMSLLDEVNVSEKNRAALVPVVDNLAWLRAKLDETREMLMESEVVMEYNNGGGQEGIRENPAFKAYVNLWRAYMMGFEKFSSYLPKEIQEEVNSEAQSVMDKVKGMRVYNGGKTTATN